VSESLASQAISSWRGILLSRIRESRPEKQFRKLGPNLAPLFPNQSVYPQTENNGLYWVRFAIGAHSSSPGMAFGCSNSSDTESTTPGTSTSRSPNVDFGCSNATGAELTTPVSADFSKASGKLDAEA